MYRPLEQTAEETTEYDTLVEGVPHWLLASVSAWFEKLFFPDGYPDEVCLHRVERDLRISLDWKNGGFSALRSLRQMWTADEHLGLRLLDHQLHQLRWTRGRDAIREMAACLEDGGSAWKVAVRNDAQNEYEAIFGLERRVDPTVVKDAQMAMNRGKSGVHLREAWNAAFSVTPNPSYAYDQVIKAVEAAAAGKIGVDKDMATLGSRLGDFIASESSYRSVLQGQGSSAPGAASKWDTSGVTIGRLMLQLLWTSQDDRHGDPDPSRPISVSQAEAEAAVHLGVLLVQWLGSGALRKV